LRYKFALLFWIVVVSASPQNHYAPSVQLPELDAIPQTRFSFAVIGDRTGAGSDSWSIFDRAVYELNLLRPDFCLMIGDLIEGRSDLGTVQQQWREAVPHLDSLHVPLLLIPGNHDISSQQSYSLWTERLGKPYYAFDYRGCHFLMLNTEEIQGDGEDGFGSKQILFAEQDIRKNQFARHFFVFMHQPAWTLNGVFKTQWSRMESLLPTNGVTVVAGHVHTLAMTKQNGKIYLIVGPTGGKLRLERNPALGLFHHVTWFSVENGQSTVAFIEPGRIVSEKTAMDAYDLYLKGLLLLKGRLSFP
jgi:predicted phosphodiesterase